MVRCKAKATLENSYCLVVNCDLEQGHQGMHWHSNYVDIKEGGECNIDVCWGED